MKNKTTFLGKGKHDIIVNGQATKKQLVYNTCRVLHWGLSREEDSIHLTNEQEEQLRSGLLS